MEKTSHHVSVPSLCLIFALLDPARDELLHFALVQADTVERIQIAGGYVWAQFDWHLYRAPLSALQ